MVPVTQQHYIGLGTVVVTTDGNLKTRLVVAVELYLRPN